MDPSLPDPQLETPKVTVARHFEDAEHQHLVELIADMVERLIAHNDQIPFDPDSLTRFHSRSPPCISVHDYLVRIMRYANVDRSCLLITLHYIDQICNRIPTFTINSLTVHRFIIASITVSSKALCDVFCTNTHYAKVGGIKPGELNMLEREFLGVIDWRLFCTRELLQSYYVNLVRTHSKGSFSIDDPSPSQSIFPNVPTGDSDSLANPEDGVAAHDPDEADSTAHAASGCSDDEGMRSDSSSDTEEDSGGPSTMPTLEDMRVATSPSGPVHSTPRTPAKRRAETAGTAEPDEDDYDTRPRGRRRVEEPS